MGARREVVCFWMTTQLLRGHYLGYHHSLAQTLQDQGNTDGIYL